MLVNPVVSVVFGFGEECGRSLLAQSGRDCEAARPGADDDHVVDKG
jgi:hypothetical protein